jgi:hypothetical protein
MSENRSMKNALLALVVAVGCALTLPGVAVGQATTQDSVVGTGSLGFSSFSLDVRSGPLGELPSGSVSVSLDADGPLLVSDSIACLAVDGNAATFAGTWGPNPDGMTHFAITVIDAGPAASTPDSLSFVSTTNAPVGCGGHGGVLGPLAGGEVVVTDAQPLPTAKERCKNGGWRTYGVFKNQGDCGSFVATSAKNPPGKP